MPHPHPKVCNRSPQQAHEEIITKLPHFLMYLSAAIPGGVTLGMYADFLALVANFKSRMGDWIAFVLS